MIGPVFGVDFYEKLRLRQVINQGLTFLTDRRQMS